MSKYGESIGIWEITIGGANLRVKPRKGDNLELMGIFKRNKNDEDKFTLEVYDFIKKLIERDNPPSNEQEKEELDSYVEFYLFDLLKEMMITFRWATKESLEEATKLKK